MEQDTPNRLPADQASLGAHAACNWLDHAPGLSEKDREWASPTTVMLEMPAIREYLRDVAPITVRERAKNLFLGFALAVATCVIAVAGNWELFARYHPKEFQPIPNLTQFHGIPPETFRSEVAEINSLIGDTHEASACEKLRILQRRLEDDPPPGSEELAEWTAFQLLVSAWQEPPATIEEPARWYDALAALAKDKGRAHPSFAGMEAYAHILNDNGATANAERLLELVTAMRADYGREMNRNRDLLRIEAERHIAALPLWRQTEPDFSNHWRHVFHAVSAFGQLSGAMDEEYLQLERLKWTTMRRCFHLPGYFNAGRSLAIGKNSYTWEYLEERIAEIDRDLEILRKRPGA